MDTILQSVTYTDIPTLAQIAADSFLTDRHTQVKQLGSHPYDMNAAMRSDLAQGLASERHVYKRAVNKDTGQILGYCGWEFRVDDYGLVPRSDPGRPPPQESAVADGESDAKKGRKDEGGSDENDAIAKLCELEDADMEHWMATLMPEGTQCMYICGLYVAPDAHRKGVGRTLMDWGTGMADQLGIFTWVHSSEDACEFYAKHGFEVVGELDIDLDAWAPAPPPSRAGLEGEQKWGRYVLRYMKRPAR